VAGFLGMLLLDQLQHKVGVPMGMGTCMAGGPRTYGAVMMSWRRKCLLQHCLLKQPERYAAFIGWMFAGS